ncbi:hypothetical protein QAD02_005829 [Eretmocerus hayati]|uniref:Uncharacterized protein n=1 Tax=Eretmocerus hayati TaxID=131215 RepID=A0ACC2NU12_9HYME|nr:hypothetical protein QAD02_005829 [Eretmocerus hayati]
MTMEERANGIEDGSPVISTGASIGCGGATTNLGSIMMAAGGTHGNLHTIPKESPRSDSASYPLQRSSKRSFDVAFLVAPDEKLIRRQTQAERLAANLHLCTSRLMNDALRHQQQQQQQAMQSLEQDDEPRLPQNLTVSRPNRCGGLYPTVSPPPASRRPQPSPPSAFLQQQAFSPLQLSPSESRSAFTKVSLPQQAPTRGFDDGASSPGSCSSVSPDVVAYRGSLSPSPVQLLVPPTTGKVYSAPAKLPGYPFIDLAPHPPTALLEAGLACKPSGSPPRVAPPNQQSPHSQPPMAPYMGPYPVGATGPHCPLPAVFPPSPRGFLAAASLLPSSLAALALPAQNVCAKCNLSFRMTSDLVYHMRSHHKNEHGNEAARRRREEKLRCPVCDESFRERHHLTRHMTAHQDKESDAIASGAASALGTDPRQVVLGQPDPKRRMAVGVAQQQQLMTAHHSK